MTDVVAIEEEYLFIAGYHQWVEKEWHKAWQYRHIKLKKFQPNDFILLYNNKFLKHPGKIRTHWLGPYVVE